MRSSWVLFAALAAFGCGQFLGLDDYEEAQSSSVVAGSGAGTTSTGAAAGAGGSSSICGAYCQLVKRDMPMAYWRLGEAKGEAEAADEMGTFPGSYAPGSGVLTLGAPSLTTETGTAVAIDNGARGTATIRVDDGPYFPGVTTFTLEVWVKPIDVQYAAMIEKHELGGQGGGTLEQGYVLTYDAPNLFRFGRIQDGAHDTVSAPLPVVAEVYHVVATYDGAYICIHVNGNQEPCVPTSVSLVVIDRPLVMGREMKNGILDEVAVYNYALNLPTIQEHYNAGKKP